jgi:hypothetical protein
VLKDFTHHQYSYATLSLVATVGGGTIALSNALFSTIWHGVHFSVKDLYGTVSILLGVILIAMSSPQDKQYNLLQVI